MVRSQDELNKSMIKKGPRERKITLFTPNNRIEGKKEKKNDNQILVSRIHPVLGKKWK